MIHGKSHFLYLFRFSPEKLDFTAENSADLISNKEKYQAIEESDRMTLKFTKLAVN